MESRLAEREEDRERGREEGGENRRGQRDACKVARGQLLSENKGGGTCEALEVNKREENLMTEERRGY